MSLRTRWTLYFGGGGGLLIAMLGWLYYESARDVLIDRAWRQLESVRSIKQNSLQNQFQLIENEVRQRAREARMPSGNIDSSNNNHHHEIGIDNRNAGSRGDSALPKGVLSIQTFTSTGSSNAFELETHLLPELRKWLSNLPSIPNQPNGNPQTSIWTDYIGIGENARRYLLIRERSTIWVATLGPQSLQDILAQREGLGLSGESYLVGQDGYLRSDSRFYSFSTIGRVQATDPKLKEAFAGKSTTGIVDDYRGVRVVSACAPLQVAGLGWVLVSDIDYAEVMAPLWALRNRMLMLGFLGVIIFAFLAGIAANRMAAPARNIRNHLQTLARGSIPEPLPPYRQQDEFGAMISALRQLETNLRRTAHFAQQIGHGNLNAEHEPLGEQDNLGKSLIEMRDNLKHVLTQLETVSQLRLKEQAERGRLQRQALIDGQEQERSRLARELHDSVGQLLTALKFGLAALPIDSHQLKAVSELANETVSELRRISGNLMPGVLMDFGIEAALKQLADQTHNATGVVVQFVSQNERGRPPRDVETGLYRVAQEAIQNALKHAQAQRMELRLQTGPRSIVLEISDNGKGFVAEAREANNHVGGLAYMRDRMELLGGTLDVVSKPGQGAYIRATVPWLTTSFSFNLPN